jgi:D-3-phosphoglycerate dehydrogenase / 2-oxoglutarate reductase
MRIIIPDDYQDAVRHLDCFAKLREHDVTIYNDTVTGVDALAERFRDADALVLIRERTSVDDELLSRLPRLKLISQTGKGAAHIDLDACKRRGVTVAVGTGSPYAPAELTWALVLAAMRRIPQEVANLRAGHWQHFLGTTVRGRILGIYGYGKIGSIVAGYGRAFGMRVIAWGREGSRERALADGYEFAPSQESFFAMSDVLSLHVRLTDETRGIVTATDLARMKSTALLVNTSRAELIESGALEGALRNGRPGFAAVDVYEEEPIIGARHPLLKMDKLYFGQAFDNVNAFSAR